MGGMFRYPKIETIYERDHGTHKVMEHLVREPEFESVCRWHFTEKIDGTNIRVLWSRDIHEGGSLYGSVRFGGRTDNAQIQATLIEYLGNTFVPGQLHEIFDVDVGDVTLFGEGFGPKIQKGGGAYSKEVGFCLFDVLLSNDDRGSIWLKQEAVIDIAHKLGVPHAPVLGVGSASLGIELARAGFDSLLAKEMDGSGRPAEGVVSRSEPLLLNRLGKRVMWKLKHADFG